MRRSVLLLPLLLCLPAALRAQVPARCSVVPDSVAAPTPQQIAEADSLRERLRAQLREEGLPERGLLMVDVEESRQGRLLFIDADLPEEARARIIGRMQDYLDGLPPGRRYQALVRIDATYPAVAPGRRLCRADLDNPQTMLERIQEVARAHPEAGRHRDRPLELRPVVLVVIAREGHVAYAEVVRSSGDAFVDEHAAAVGMALRFDPAALDEVPIDVRMRVPLVFYVR